MLEFVVYTTAQDRTKALAHEALADAPVQPDASRARRRLPDPRLRQRLGRALRRLADRLEPVPAPCEPGIASSR